jgi:hypothetical protein
MEERMHFVRVVVASLVIAGCSQKGNVAVAKVDEPWSHAYSGGKGWWKDWDTSLGGKAPFGVGTQFEVETIRGASDRDSTVYEVTAIRPSGNGAFEVTLHSDGHSMRAEMPPALAYSPGSAGALTTRNEKLVWVTVPAGKFAAGRLWTPESRGSEVYERDEWVVADLPLPLQSWSRPVLAKDLYNPPADDSIPAGSTLRRLIRIDRK